MALLPAPTYEAEEGGEGLLLGQVPGRPEHDNHRIGGELLLAATVSLSISWWTHDVHGIVQWSWYNYCSRHDVAAVGEAG
jgi:hypothetical protein